jgi:hypothetical protein
MNTRRALVPFLIVSFGFACGGTAMDSPGSGGSPASGQGGSSESGGVTSAGGSSAAGGVLGSGGAGTGGVLGSGGSATTGGTKSGTGGVTGGKGGSRTGGTVTGGVTGSGVGGISGTGGCPTIGACPAIGCLYGELPNPNPCGCPICAPAPDAGTIKDASSDLCIALPCALPICGPGYVIVTPPCGCGTCVPVDGGQPDAIVCTPQPCPQVKCAPGAVPTLDACGCTVCGFPDAGTDTGKLACVGLDECSCLATKGCAPIAESCYCPTQCTGAVCVCGGGRFLGCAPTDLNTCTAAKARVGSLCPQLKGATWDGLCQQSDSACVTKCLDEVTSCGDLSCSMCEACDCASDAFMRCRGACPKTLSTARQARLNRVPQSPAEDSGRRERCPAG